MTTVWSARELVSTRGLTPYDLARQVRLGSLVHLRRGWYTDDVALDREARHRALLRASAAELGPNTVFSHASAAVLHGLPVPLPVLRSVWVTRRGGGHGGTEGRLRVSQAPLRDDDLAMVDGLAVTSCARTVLDVARTVTRDWSLAIVDAALRQSGEPESLRHQLRELLAREGRRNGNPKARWAIEAGSPLAESVGESISRGIFIRHGLPTPTLQLEVRVDGAFIARADFGWEAQRTLGEFDGAIKYTGTLDEQSPQQSILAEKRREQLLRDAGWWFVRWGWEDLRDETRLVDRVRRGFDLAPRH